MSRTNADQAAGPDLTNEVDEERKHLFNTEGGEVLKAKNEVDTDHQTVLVKSCCSSKRLACSFFLAITIAIVALGAVYLLVIIPSEQSVFTDPQDIEEQAAHESELAELDDYVSREAGEDRNCSPADLAKIDNQTHAYKVKMADCGTGYPIGDDDSKAKGTHVVLFGDNFHKNLPLSGCKPGFNRCPHHPRCTISMALHYSDPSLLTADVVAITSDTPAEVITHISKKSHKPKVRRIYYWREPYWGFPSTSDQKKLFDLEMGCHMSAGILNPVFIRRPHTLLAKHFLGVEFPPYKDRTEFALSIISQCKTHSHRQVYIDHLSDYLGQERVHQYGHCGNRKMPGPPIYNAVRIIAKYKFFLSFENSLMQGYVSEKLFTVLNMQLIPVYMGTPFKAPNITKTPSYINVFDYKSPKDLAQYMLYLDKNQEAYDEYHIWRTSAKYFTEEYLDLVAREHAGHNEVEAYKHLTSRDVNRYAACCRLCNEQYLDEQIDRRKKAPESEWAIGGRMPPEKVNHRLYSGLMGQRPGAKARLAPPPPVRPPTPEVETQVKLDAPPVGSKKPRQQDDDGGDSR